MTTYAVFNFHFLLSLIYSFEVQENNMNVTKQKGSAVYCLSFHSYSSSVIYQYRVPHVNVLLRHLVDHSWSSVNAMYHNIDPPESWLLCLLNCCCDVMLYSAFNTFI